MTADDLHGVARARLEPDSLSYLLEQVNRGRRFFVTRKREGRNARRCIQASGESVANVQRAFHGWRGFDPAIIEVQPDGVIVWHQPVGEQGGAS